MQPIRLNTICYWWLLILVVTVVTTSLVSGAKRRILKIERRALSDEEACLSERAKPLEYHIDLLLREHYGFGSIRGGAQILFRLDGDRVNTSIGQRITQSVMPNLVADRHVEQEEDYISMHMNGQIEFKYAEFRVSHSIKKLHKRGRGKSIHVKRIIIDEARQMISLRLGRKLPVGKYGILRVHYETADKAHEQHAKQDLAANQLAPRVLRPTMTRLRSGRDDIRQLFPCYDDPKYQSKFRVTIIDKLDLESNVVSNLHRDSSYLGTSEREHYLFRKTNFIQSTPVAVSQLAFAVGPFANLTTHDDRHSLDPHHRPIIEHCEGFGSLTGYAKEYIADLGKWVHSSRFGSHLPASGLDPSQMLDLQHLSIKRTKDDNELGPSVESALTIALAYGRMLFATVKTASSSDSWITEGLSAHLAIRMVRELKPELQVDEFVRSKLLSWAKHYETEGNYAIMKIAYDDDDHGQGESTRRSDECILLWLFKCAALIDMIKRTFCQDQRAFDESVLALMNYYGNNNNDKGTIGLDELAAAFASEQFSRDDVSRFVKPWTELEGYPYIGVSLTKRGDSIRLDQVPINWLDYNHKHAIKADGVWPLTMRIKFHGSVKRKTHELPMREGFNGERDSVRVTLPDWLISGHKLSFDLLDQEELPYYRLSYSAELISKLNAQQ